jgi:hypothetical protein
MKPSEALFVKLGEPDEGLSGTLTSLRWQDVESGALLEKA